MVRYPYELWAGNAPAAVKDANGNYSASGGSVFSKLSVCRDEVPGKGQVLTLEDGSTALFSAVIYVPLPMPAVTTGMAIEVRKAGVGRRAWGVVKQIEENQLHVRLWV